MPLPDYLQRALGGPSTPSAPARPTQPARPSGLPSYMKRALGQPEEEEPFLPLLDQMMEEEAQQPMQYGGSPVLAGITQPAGALRTEDVPEEMLVKDEFTHPGTFAGRVALNTWQDIGDRLSAGSAKTVGALGRYARELGHGMGSGGAMIETLGSEVEGFKGQEQEAARRDIQQSASPDSLAGDVLEAAPGMVTTIGAGMLGGIPLATGVGGMQAFGGGMQEAEAGGASRDEALAYATTSAGAEMLTEQLGDVRLLRRVLEGVPENQLTTILKDMALGGAEEMAAETANSLARVMTYDDTQTPAEALAGDVDNILRSGLVGAILQGVGTGAVAAGQPEALNPEAVPPEQGVGMGAEELAPPDNEFHSETALPPGIAELRDASLAIGPRVEAAEALPEMGVERVPKGQQLYVARGADDQPVGYLLARPDEDGFRVGHVFVDEAARGQGIPEQLYRQAAEELGPYQGSTDYEGRRTEAGERMAARLRETVPEIFPQEEEVQEPQPQDQAPEPPAPSLPARLATRAGEEGFLQPRALARDIGKSLRRNFTVEGLLPARVFERKVLRDGRLAKHAEKLRLLSTDLQKALRRYKGPLSTAQLTRYLDDAYRGMNLATGPELLDPTQVQRIATRRGVTTQSVEQAMLRARESKAGGLLQAPQFIPLIREMRVETEALTRQLRRQGLLTDGVAKDLERKYGLYVHRQYEAVRNPKWQERIQERPLWDRAIELTTARWQRAVDQQRAALVKKEGVSAQEAAQKIPYKTQEQILGLLDHYISKSSNHPVLPGGRPEGALDLSATFERDILDELARSLLGEVRDVRSNLLTTVTKLSTMVEQQAFLEDVARMGKGSFLFEEPVRLDGVSYSKQIDPGLYVKAFQQAKDKSQGPGIDRLQVQESKRRTDPLGELYTSQDILDELNKIYESKSYHGFMKWYFAANAWVKMGKTIGSPLKSANRNLLSGAPYCLINGVWPTDIPEFLRATSKSHRRVASWIPGSTDRARSARVQRYLELGLGDQSATLGDIKATEKKAHIWRGEEKMSWTRRPGEFVEGLGDYYQSKDNNVVWYLFEKQLPKYRRAFPSLPVAEVEEYVASLLRDTYQNYAMVPRGVQEIGTHVPVFGPFLSFWEEVIRNTKNAVKVAHSETTSDNPELRKIGRQRIAGIFAAASIPAAASFLASYLLNYDEEDEEAVRRFMAPWDRNSNIMFLPAPREGMVRYFDWGFIDPFAYLKNPANRLLHGDVDGALEALSSPFSEEILLKYLMDIARNQKKEGGPVFNKYAPWLYRQQQKAAHLWKGLAPGTALDIQNIVDAATDNDKAVWPELVALAGPRIVTIDLAKGLTNNGFDFMTAVSARDGSRKIYRDAVRGRGPIEDQEKAWQVTERQLTYSINEMIMDIEAARQHDLSDEQIEDSLAAADVPAWLIGGLLDGATRDIVNHYRELDAGYAEDYEEDVN